MPDEKYAPEGINPGPEGAKSVWGRLSRPRPARIVRRSQPSRHKESRPVLGTSAWAASGLGSDPSLVAWWPDGSGAARPGKARRPSRERKPQPSRGSTPTQPGWRGGAGYRPSRVRGRLAQPGERGSGPVGLGYVGPAGVEAAYAGPPWLMPAWAIGLLADIGIIRPMLLLTCFFNILAHII
jgi:hypothetical protein